MQEELRSHRQFERGFEAIGWTLAAGLGAYTWIQAGSILADRLLALFLISGLFGVFSFVYHRLMPTTSSGPLRYAAEDKAVLVSLTLLLLLTAYFYELIDVPAPLFFLYLLPLLGGATILHEKIVLFEAVLSAMALVFLRASYRPGGEWLDLTFIVLLLIFAAAAVTLVLLTRMLRKAFRRTTDLSRELSVRLDQMQALCVLVRQVEFFPQFDTLMRHIVEITANALGAEKCGLFLYDPRRDALILQGQAAGSDAHERELLSIGRNAAAFREVFDSGRPRLSRLADDAPEPEGLIGFGGIKNLMAVPLKAPRGQVGVIYTANRREGDFKPADVGYFELLAGFIATLVDSSDSYRKMTVERENAEHLAKLLVGRELKMRELKEKLRDHGVV